MFEDRGLFVGISRRSILQRLGIEPKEMRGKPIIAIANSQGQFNPGHAHLRAVDERVKEGIWAAGGIPFEFGVPAVMSRISGMLDLDCLNVSGRKLGEAVAQTRVEDETVIPPLDKPRLPEGATVVLYGNLAPEGALVKQSSWIRP